MPRTPPSLAATRRFTHLNFHHALRAMLSIGLFSCGLAAQAQPVPDISLAWPVPTVARGSISQGFAQYGSGSATKFHAAIDIAGPLGSNVVAAAGGVARVILLSDSNWSNKTKCMGNVVILNHGSVSTLYAHLNSVSVANGQAVSAGQVIGTLGRSVGLTAAGGDCVAGQVGNNGPTNFEHLHFELKLYPVLGSDNDLGPPNMWGYTPAIGTAAPTLNDEPTQFNFRNPVLNMHGGIVSQVKVMSVTSLGGGVSLRHGPGTDYAALGSKSVAGEKFISMNILNSATSGCSLGWVQVRRQNASYFTDTNGGSNPAAWMCQGNAGETWVAADSVSHSLTVNRSGSGSGTVTSSPAGISCGNDCSESLPAGTTITLSASASPGSNFVGWSGAGCTGSGTCIVTLNSAATVTATFNASPVNHTLSVSRSGSGSGTVTSSPAGISCGNDCSESLPAGTTITLSASASPGSNFVGWSGAGCTGSGTCTVTLNSAATVTATFTANVVNFSLSVNRAGSGQGAIGSAPAGISCGSNCSASFLSGSTVTLSAVASAGSVFSGWSGVNCGGSNQLSSCSFTMNADKTATANFVSAIAAQQDFNDDGKSDLLWSNNNDGSVQGWLMNGLEVTQVASLLPAGDYWVSHIADLNGDGKADLLIQRVNGAIIGWLQDGLNVVEQATLSPPGAGWWVMHTADLNGDGRADLLVQHDNGAVEGWLMNGLVVTARAQFVPASSGWSIAKAVDLNGDGRADLVWQHSDGAVHGWLMDGLNATQTATLADARTGWGVHLTADLNGDGKTDLLWMSGGGAVQAWLMDGLSVLEVASYVPAGTGWFPRIAGDIDGDGKDDLFWQHTTGRSQTWLMNGLSVTNIASFVSAGSWHVTHLLDLDGDGRRDVLWQHADGTVQAWLLDGLNVKQIASLARAGKWEVIPIQE